jgi:methionine synthase I (cobalamin-dependent)
MPPTLAELRGPAGRPVRLDGGVATLLQARGQLAPFTSPSPLVRDDPEALVEAHRAFVEAGAEVVLSATLCASPLWLGEGSAPINTDAVALAREAVRRAGRHAWVAGSMGPASTLARPWAGPGDSVATASWRAQAEALSDADLLVLETFVSPAELLAAIAAIRPAWPGVLVACLCPDAGGGIGGGGLLPDALSRLADAGADVVGLNCGGGMDGMEKAVGAPGALRGTTGVPTWVKPSASGLDAATWRRRVAGWEVDFLGGCCGVAPGWVR